MVGKVSERVLAREGLERTDNGMRTSSWPEVAPINQKNYYTDYMKRDDQILALRLQNDANRDRLVQSHRDRDRALALKAAAAGGAEVSPLPPPAAAPGEDEPEPPPPPGAAGAGAGPDVTEAAHVVVIHPGSQNLRIGLASDALPKTIPMALATRYPAAESDGVPPRPARDLDADAADAADDQPGREWARRHQRMCEDLRLEMRASKRKLPPNPREQVLNFNRRAAEPDLIPQHNDPLQVEWTDPAALPAGSPLPFFIGADALRVPDDSDPRFRLTWPMRHGCLNEADYASREEMFNSFESVIDKAIRHDLGIPISQLNKYSCMFVIPDLYDKRYVEQMLRSCVTWFEFNRVAFMQESLAATFGAGYAQACVVDVGAQKTAVSCVEDGAVIDDSRVNVKFGGRDVTETFVRMLLCGNFPYRDINLLRRYDFLLAEELKMKHCTLDPAHVSASQSQQLHVRAPNQPTRKYQFKMFDEVILAPTGLFEPAIFDNSAKLAGRRRLLPFSVNPYDVDLPDDPTPAAQTALLALTNPAIGDRAAAAAAAADADADAAAAAATALGAQPAAATVAAPPTLAGGAAQAEVSTPMKEKLQPFAFTLRFDTNGTTPSASSAPSPGPDGTSTPIPGGGGPSFIFSAGSPAPPLRNGTPVPPPGAAPAPEPAMTPRDAAVERDGVLPIAPLDQAIMLSIQHAARGDEKRMRDLVGSIMVVGGGAKIPRFAAALEERLRALRPDLADRILVSRSARDMDEQVVVWKGASVFAKLPTNDSWVTPHEVERLGSRALWQRLMFNW